MSETKVEAKKKSEYNAADDKLIASEPLGDGIHTLELRSWKDGPHKWALSESKIGKGSAKKKTPGKSYTKQLNRCPVEHTAKVVAILQKWMAEGTIPAPKT